MKENDNSVQLRTVSRTITPQLTSDGAGVRLRRSIASSALDHLDPFLLLDEFGSDNPDDYIAGFPMHPHRGIETVTYMLAGAVQHRDSIGNTGIIESGDVQWMTAGRGIMHEEMPQLRQDRLAGFQLWVNLPAKLKMTAPRYQEVEAASIPLVEAENGVRIRVITGRVGDVTGPVSEIAVQPSYLDVAMPPDCDFEHPIPRGHTAFAYVFDGSGEFGFDPSGRGATGRAPELLVLGDGDLLRVHTAQQAVRFLLVSGRPLNEPIARYGPFVMNTREEILQTLQELQDGTFIQD